VVVVPTRAKPPASSIEAIMNALGRQLNAEDAFLLRSLL